MQEFFEKSGIPGIFPLEEMKEFEQLLCLNKDINAWWSSLKSVDLPVDFPKLPASGVAGFSTVTTEIFKRL